MRKTETIFVRNNGRERFESRYDGEDFAIEPGQAIEVEADCAKLVFGFGEPDKARAIRRLGWAPTASEMERALKRLNVFSFHMTEREAEEHKASSSYAPAAGGEAAGTPSGRPAATDHRPRRKRAYKRRAKRAAPPKQESVSPQPSAAG